MNSTITFRIDSSDNYSLSPFYAEQLTKVYKPLSLDPSANVIEIDLDAQTCKTYEVDDVRGYSKLCARTYRLLSMLPKSRLYVILEAPEPLVHCKHYLLVLRDGSQPELFPYTSFCMALEDLLDQRAIEIDVDAEDFLMENS